MDGLIAALRKRGVSDECLEKLQQDKIDPDVAKLMHEEELSRYLPRYGDRVFARNWKEMDDIPESVQEQKEKLINRLREKMKLPAVRIERSAPKMGNKNAERKTRQIELGWMHYQDCIYKQVRRTKGGGTRVINLKKDDTVLHIMAIGKNLFFPNGISKKGNFEDMDVMVCLTGTNEPLSNSVTVRDLYDQTHYRILRLYLCSKPKDCDLNSPMQSSNPESPCALLDNAYPHEDPHPHELPDNSQHPGTSQSPECLVILDNTESSDRPQSQESSDHLFRIPNNTLHLDTPQSPDDEVVFLSCSDQVSVVDLNETLIYSPLHSSGETGITLPHCPEVNPGSAVIYQNAPDCSSVFLTDTVRGSCTQSSSGSETAVCTFFEDPENVVEKQTILIHHANCLSDMVEAFTDENILHANITIRRVLENGEEESAVGNGVIQDCLTDFWNQFYEKRTCGTTYKIPTLHHTYQEREWKAVARIFAYGWRFGYLPMQLAPPFLEEVLSLPSQESSLMDAFFHYISATEMDVLMEGLNDFKHADKEEILSVLSGHNCTVMPTEQNLQRILEEVAHKELVQQPAYIIKCWKPVLREVGERISVSGLHNVLSDLKPNARKVAKFIRLPINMSQQETTTSNHLLRFVRERDNRELSLFLHYCTGSDLFLCKTITVTFREMSDFERRPVAHTCSCQLELACEYASYADFQAEFSSVLNCGVWSMDIV